MAWQFRQRNHIPNGVVQVPDMAVLEIVGVCMHACMPKIVHGEIEKRFVCDCPPSSVSGECMLSLAQNKVKSLK